MLAANHPWLNKAKRPMSSSWQCCTLPDILLLRCTERFLWIQKLSVFSLHWCHRIPNSMSSCSAGRRFEQKTPMSTMVWLRKYPAQTCSKLSKQKIRNQAFRRFGMKIWCNLQRISRKEKPTSLDLRVTYGKTWEGQPIVAPLECVDFWQSSRGDVRCETQKTCSVHVKFQPHTEAVHDTPRNV